MLHSRQARRYCRYCGVSVNPNDSFCSSCGEHLASKEVKPSVARGAPPPSRINAKRPGSSMWPSDAGREILIGILVAVGVAGLLLGLVYALLALRGALGDPSAPRTLGLIVFSLVHGGGVSVSVPSSPSLLGIGGSFRLGLPLTSFALLPFVAMLVISRVVARRTESPLLFASVTAVAYAALVAALAALGNASSEASEGIAVEFAADPLSAAWRAFLLAGVGTLLGAAVAHGPLLPERLRQVARGAFVAVGVSLAITVLLAV